MIGEPEAASAAPLSRRLQEGTREVHERVEHTASFNRLIVIRLPEDASPASAARLERARADYREVYRRFLVASYGFESAVDAALAASPAHASAVARGYAPEAHAPAALVREDVRRVFGASDSDALEPMDGLAVPASLPAFVGTEYVRRGSRAGGAVIAAVVRHNLGLTREEGGSFLMAYGKRTRAIVTAFKDWADGLGFPDVEVREAVRAAVATFEAVQRWHALLDQRFARG